MPLNDRDKKLCKEALQLEYDGVKDFFKNDLKEGWLLIDLDSKEDEVVTKFRILMRKGCTVAEINSCVRDIIDEFREELENEYEYDEDYEDFEDFVLDAEVQSVSVLGMNHVEFQWTKKMIKEAKDLEDATKKSKQLKTWEHSYKKAVDSGVNIMELDESIKSTIAKYLRDMKGAKKKGAKRKDKRSKKKTSKKKTHKSK